MRYRADFVLAKQHGDASVEKHRFVGAFLRVSELMGVPLRFGPTDAWKEPIDIPKRARQVNDEQQRVSKRQRSRESRREPRPRRRGELKDTVRQKRDNHGSPEIDESEVVSNAVQPTEHNALPVQWSKQASVERTEDPEAVVQTEEEDDEPSSSPQKQYSACSSRVSSEEELRGSSSEEETPVKRPAKRAVLSEELGERPKQMIQIPVPNAAECSPTKAKAQRVANPAGKSTERTLSKEEPRVKVEEDLQPEAEDDESCSPSSQNEDPEESSGDEPAAKPATNSVSQEKPVQRGQNVLSKPSRTITNPNLLAHKLHHPKKTPKKTPKKKLKTNPKSRQQEMKLRKTGAKKEVKQEVVETIENGVEASSSCASSSYSSSYESDDE
jgi:hypothetical protein